MIRVGPGGGGSPGACPQPLKNEEAPAVQGEGDDSQEGNPMNDLQIFNYKDTPVRTVIVDDEPWFVASDVAQILGYRDAYNMARRLDPEDRGTHSVSTPSGDQHMTVISEAGLYVAVLGSQIPGAKDFKRWVTRKVLPSIRKTGGYGQVAPSGPELVALALIEAQGMLEAKDQRIAALEPKARAWDQIVNSEASWAFNDAAKFLFEHKRIVIGEKRLFNRCENWGYLYRDHKKRPHVYQRYVEQGLFAVKARVYTDQETGEIRESGAPQVRVTGKGLDAIFRRLTDGQLEIAL